MVGHNGERNQLAFFELRCALRPDFVVPERLVAIFRERYERAFGSREHVAIWGRTATADGFAESIDGTIHPFAFLQQHSRKNDDWFMFIVDIFHEAAIAEGYEDEFGLDFLAVQANVRERLPQDV